MVLKKQHSNTAFNNKTALPSTRTWDRHRCFVKCSLVFAWNGRGCLTRHHFWTFPPIPFHHYVHEILIVLEQHTPFQISPSIHCFRPVYEIVTVFHDSGPQASKHFFSIASMNELGMVLKRQHRQSAIVVHLSKFPRFAFHQCHRAWPLGDSPALPRFMTWEWWVLKNRDHRQASLQTWTIVLCQMLPCNVWRPVFFAFFLE